MKTNQEILDRILFLQNTMLIQTASMAKLVGELTAESFKQVKALAESNERISREIVVLRNAMKEK